MSNQIVISSGAKVRELEGVLTGTSGVVNSLPINASNGIPQLDVNGKILVSQLPNSVMEYQGVWNANTNTPTLTNGGAFNQGDVYLCNVAGTTNFGAGPISFIVGDQAIFSSVAEGSIWQKAGGASGTVTSVAITESGDSLNITGSPITTSGTINIGFNGTNLQYINGAGNLTTFPSLTGYVPYTGATANVNIGTHSFIANDGTYNTEMSPSLFGVENATGLIFGLLEYNKLTLTNNTGVASVMEVNAQGLIFPDASVQTSSYTDAKARLALSLTTTGTSGVATYNNTTGVFNIPNYGSALSGYVPYTGATSDVDLDTHVLNAQALHVKGTAGNGHLGLKHQSASPASSANESLIFADVNGDMGWLNGNLYLHKFITSANTANRSYTFPDATCNIPNDSLVVHLAGTETITGAKTFSGGATFTSSLTTTSNVTFSNSGFTLVLQPPTLSVNRTVTLPNGTGTLALTSDISYPVTSVFGRTGAVVATSGDYTTAQVTESGNLYFTDSRARLALSAGTGISYNNTTGVITNSAPDQTVALTASTGISVTGTYPNFTITNTSPSSGGTVTSVAALTIGTSGTDLSSTVANSTTTPVITLNVPTASATNRGVLASADWTTFNSKQGTITLTTTGTSGAATFTSNTLNIPNYGSALSGYLPLTGGTLTGALNGTSAVFSSSVTALEFGASSGIYVAKNGSNTQGSGPYFLLANASASQLWYQQLNASNGLDFWYNGSVKLNIASTGAATFSSSIASSISGSGDNAFLLATGSGTGARYSYIANDGAAAIFGIEKAAGGAILGGSSAYATVLYSNNATPLQLGTNQLVRMTITSGGNVGIGTSSPDQKLTIQASGGYGLISYKKSDATTTAYVGISDGAGNIISTSSAGDLCLRVDGTNAILFSSTGNAERMRITSGGNVGIGTSSPLSLLHIASADTDQGIRLTRANGTYGFRFTRTGNIQGTLADGTTFQTAISLTEGNASGNQYLALQPTGGNVLIGTTDDGSGSKVLSYSTTAATQFKAAGTAPAITFTNTITGASYGGVLGACTSANQFISGTSAGDMVLANQFSGYRLYAVSYSGGVYLTSGATSWTANSDIRLKNINSHIENAVEKLSTLQTINFSYKDDKFNKQNIGLIAQEVEKIFPELIDKNGDGMLGVRYTELVPVLIKAVQELKLEIETLKNK